MEFYQAAGLSDVRFQGQQTFGLLWAHTNSSAVLSLALAAHWEPNEITAQLEELSESGFLISSDISVPNISNIRHVDDHRQLLTIERAETSSSIVYDGNDFVARFYFFDHNPPHFHVCSTGHPRTTLATFNIRMLNVLEGKLPSGMERTVRTWAESRTADLMENWNRCSQGQHPFPIE
jgi:hypothetical protein